MAKDTTFKIRAGHGQQLGANYDGKGVNFALFSAHAERVELCLFDPSGKTEIARLTLPENTHEVWHGYVPAFWVQPRDFSSSVVIPPALLPGDGFS